MRPKISWSDLAGGAVGVWGAGVEGRAGARKLRTLGVTPRVVVDDRAADEVEGLPVVLTAEGGLEELARCEVVIKSPGISRYRPDVAALEERHIPVVGGLGLWMEEADRDRVLCVTGTKGKSTTVSVAGHLLGQLGRRTFLGGNLGQPPFDPDAPSDVDFWVIETSSFQATDLASSPPVVAVTSLHPDHLDWHGSVEGYYRDKLSLCTQPGAAVTVANGEDPRLRAHRRALGPEVVWVTDGDPLPAWVGELGLLGRHNARNALIARRAIQALGVPADDDVLAGLGRGFETLPSRLRPIGDVAGVTFVDDSLSTNVLPTVAALSVFEHERVALLVGGYDRHIDYSPLAAALIERPAPTLLLALPETGRAVVAALAVAAHPGLVEVLSCDELDRAVAHGFAWAGPGGVVLLSPAAASFGRYRNYQERAMAFSAAMEACRRDIAELDPGDQGAPGA